MDDAVTQSWCIRGLFPGLLASLCDDVGGSQHRICAWQDSVVDEVDGFFKMLTLQHRLEWAAAWSHRNHSDRCKVLFGHSRQCLAGEQQHCGIVQKQTCSSGSPDINVI